MRKPVFGGCDQVSILESYIHSYQTWFKSIKDFAKTESSDTKNLTEKIQSLWPWP